MTDLLRRLPRRGFLGSVAAGSAIPGFVLGAARSSFSPSGFPETRNFWYRPQPPGPDIDSHRNNKAFGFLEAEGSVTFTPSASTPTRMPSTPAPGTLTGGRGTSATGCVGLTARPATSGPGKSWYRSIRTPGSRPAESTSSTESDLKESGRCSPTRFHEKNSDGWCRVDLRSGWIDRAEIMYIKPKD